MLKYVSLYFLLVPILILPFDWYRNMVINPMNFQRENVNGLYVITKDSGRILIIYLLCILIQVLAIKSQQIFFSIFTNVLLVLILMTFPVTAEIIKYLNLSDLFQYYGKGANITIMVLILGVCFNVYQLINKKNQS